MKATKIFMMAALALMTAACSNDDNDLAQQPAEQPANDEITITATVSSDNGATTRALSIDGSNIASTWESTDQFAILFNDGSNNVKRTATVQSINGSSVTITFTIPASLADNTPCTIVYPASAAKADNSGADVATALATQDGTIENSPEVRVGTATIDKDNHSLSDVTKLAAQNAIFKFTLKDIAGTSNKSATEFKVSDDSGNVITTVTPGSATSELYVALPTMAAGTYWFNATVESDSKPYPYIARATVSTATTAGTYYQTTVKMATIGDVLLRDGKFAAKGTDNEQAVIAYVGTVDNYFSHFLALALTDVDGDKHNWADALTKVGNYAAAHPVTIGSTTYNTSTTGDTYYDKVASDKTTSSATATAKQTGWRLPSVTDWRYVFDGLGRIKGGLALYNKNSGLYLFPTIPLGVSDGMTYRDGDNGSSLQNAINNACNTALQSGDEALYWSSSEYTDSGYAWLYNFNTGIFWKNYKDGARYVRAVFAY